MSTLTRAQAHQLVDEAHRIAGRGSLMDASAVCLMDLHEHWIGHRDVTENDTANSIAEALHDYVDECCNGDDVRSNGPHESDPTDLTEPTIDRSNDGEQRLRLMEQGL